MIFNDDVPVEVTSSEPLSDEDVSESESADVLIDESEDVSEAESSEADTSVSVIYVGSTSDVTLETVEAYEPEYLNYNMIFGIVFGIYLIMKLMKFVSKALFVRFDGGGTKEA